MSEFDLFRVRIALLRDFCAQHGYDGLLLSRVDNFAMATGGRRNFVNRFQDGGVCSLFVTPESVYFVGNTIESPRIMDEELAEFGCETRDFLWFESSAAAVVEKEFSGRFASDDGALGDSVNGKLARIRSLLTPREVEKYRRLGRIAAESMECTLDAIEQGMGEDEIAGWLMGEGAARDAHTPVVLVAADDRIAHYRHPLPSTAGLLNEFPVTAVEDYVMVVGCFQADGLVCSITRFKRTGELPEGIADAYGRICAVDARMQEATQPGRTLGDVFSECQRAYPELGFRDNEWHYHHQGGATGYSARTAKGAPDEPFPILGGHEAQAVGEATGLDIAFAQAFAWNPSGIGVKSEDTFLLLPDGAQEIITKTPALPPVDLEPILGRETPVVKSGIAE